ncbi:flagellar hook protein FlgE [Hyphomicrobium sp. LHD-15]|uniref:flagellar hook protein FlgE n=1 Tax=Hyphomicrobium sp. LHD-15 TaxID=3072142 RepID=UPI00280F7A6E|nr:flagellar hook protein FlgE [Hyphomicrobium sp. LHD-15]MDQ8699058.1 flagellar hook protein FlgE [Hyphomicrobium sp. LHD-15]
MSISGMMRTSASGMAAQSSRLGTVSDNIANASTHGYKRAFTEFSTVVLESGSGSYVPGSVDTQVRYGITQQGGFDYTTSSTDLAVSGNGFFLVNDAAGKTFLTRAGSFVKIANGDLVNAAGFTLQGYPLNGGVAAVSANGTTGLQNVNISGMALTATPSTSGTFYVNVPEDAEIETDLPSGNAATASYSAKTSMTVVDNVGREVTMDIYYTKTADNTWEVSFFDASEADATTKGFPYGSGPLASETLTFDPSTGQLDTALPSPTYMDIPVPNGQTLRLDMAETSELADDFQIGTSEVNGNEPSSVESVEFADDGTLYAVYGNGARVGIYKIPLATVASPDNLTPEAGNTYSVSADSGNLQLGFAGTGTFGTIKSSQLEKSTVDTATELTTMIESQFAFTANSKVFQTGGELMEVLVNLKR